jgi:hypothetical protein
MDNFTQMRVKKLKPMYFERRKSLTKILRIAFYFLQIDIFNFDAIVGE